jgi:hypothetical protein
MNAAIWKSRDDGCGIRFGLENAEKYFRKEWTDVNLSIDGKIYNFKLSEIFWTTCPEIRGGPIKKWFMSRGIHRWDDGKGSYKLELIPLGYNKFKLLESTGERGNGGRRMINIEILVD